MAQALAALGLGLALAGAPGPVQVIIFAETARGGIARGIRVVLGANLTFAFLLLALALGVSLASPSGIVLRLLKVVGGAFLLWIAWDGFRNAAPATEAIDQPSRSLPPTVRGILAVIFNPGGWIFLATVASSLLSTSVHNGGRPLALLTAALLVCGIGAGDVAVGVLAGLGIRWLDDRTTLWIRGGLNLILVVLALWLLLTGMRG